MQTMTALDASFLSLETATLRPNIGGLVVFDGDPPSQEELVDHLTARLAQIPRYRQRVRFPPLALTNPVWVDDERFEVSRHVHRINLPAHAGERGLCDVVAEVMARRLDRRRPLWEMHVVEGLDDGHWALISRVHHAVVDGVAGNALLGVILDSEPAPAHHPIVTWRARRQPSGARLLAASINQRLAIVAGLPSVARVEGWPTRGGAWSAARSAAMLATGLLRPATTALNGTMGSARRWTRAQVRLQDVRAVRKAFGGTVNDVALAAIANGFRQLLIARGEEPDGKCVRTLVPVSVRAPGCRREDNRVSAIFVDLPVAQSSAVERLESISEQTERAKDSGEAFAGQMAAALFELAPAPILNLGTKLSVELGQTAVQTIVSNVPGSPAPLYLLGRRAVEISAYIPVGMGLRICLAAFSYDGTLSFSITGDRDTAPDIQVLARGVTEGMAALVAAARRSGNGRG
jgi:WS/DGAT/MGAT family acyltransferase